MTKLRLIRTPCWWSIYHIKSALKLVGIVETPDAETAIARAIEEYNVPPNERGRLMRIGGGISFRERFLSALPIFGVNPHSDR